MNKKKSLIFKPLELSYPELPNIIAPSIGVPTEEKIKKVLAEYTAANNHLVGCFSSKKLIGVIGIEIQGGNGIIKHIAVSPEHRMKNVGKQLIIHVARHFTLQLITAEIDDEAIGFYKRCGFKCDTFEGQYVRRYTCKLIISEVK
jgi:ribosomal protein S18 acetylase RimI-like enzyme